MIERIEQVLLAQRGHLLGWVPVCLAIGIGLHASLRQEPDLAQYLAVGVGVVLCVGLARLAGDSWRPVAAGVALIGIGLLLAGYRANHVAAPVLGFRYYGAIEGRVVRIDRSSSDALRLTLDRVVLEDTSPERTPERVRISLHGDQHWSKPEPGMVVMLTGHLSPPGGPSEPGSFDFQRSAWYDRLGAVGYTRTPVLRLENAPEGWPLWVGRVRMQLSQAVQAQIPGESGAFASALTTGDRSAMGQQTVLNLRASNLAHLVSISGLHMGLLAGFVFGIVRLGLALTPFGLRWNSKKISAVIALLAASVYLVISGAEVATNRSYIMISVMLVAVLLDRRAYSLRSVAIAATILLVVTPEELLGPGFQMSFAATAALVAAFANIGNLGLRKLPKPLEYVAVLLLSSLVAGLATAPFGAAHFNQISHYGLFANLLSVPVMGAIIMPGAVVAACLAPFGLEWIAFDVMRYGLDWILWVADWITTIDGSLGHVVTPPKAVLPLISLGGLALMLWQGRLAWLGLCPVLIGFWLWFQVERPDLLIAQTGTVMGVMTAEGRAISSPKGDGFTVDNWLENDGAPVPQDVAATRPGFTRGDHLVRLEIGGQTVVLVRGKTATAALQGCDGADILVTDQRDQGARPCRVFDADILRRAGTVAGNVTPQGLKLTTARDVTGERLWNGGAKPIHWRDLWSRYASSS